MSAMGRRQSNGSDNAGFRVRSATGAGDEESAAWRISSEEPKMKSVRIGVFAVAVGCALALQFPAEATAEKLGFKGGIPHDAVEANCDYVGEGYGIPTEGMGEAMTLLARHEGIFLDPVYSGKGMAGLIDLIRKGAFRKDENVVFLHTGGQVGIFGYRDFLTNAAA